MDSAYKPFLSDYNGQTTAELIALEQEYRVDSIIIAFETALYQRAESRALTREELYVLAIENLEREVHNGGYHQFFANPSRKYTHIIIEALHAIQCPKTAELTQKMIHLAGISDNMSDQEIENAVVPEDDEQYHQLLNKLDQYDSIYWNRLEDVEENLFEFIKNNRDRISADM